MKLYATTTSERATKGQGGNIFLDIEVKDELKNNILNIKLSPFGENKLTHCIIRKEGDEKILWAGYLKGKSQKGECKHFIVKDDYGKEYCQECGQYNNLN